MQQHILLWMRSANVRVSHTVQYVDINSRSGLPGWRFLGLISEIWPRFKLVGLKSLVGLLAFLAFYAAKSFHNTTPFFRQHVCKLF